MKKFLVSFALLLTVSINCNLLAQDKPKAEPVKHGRGYKPLPPEKAKALHDEAFKRHGYLMRRLAKNVTPPAVYDNVTLGFVGPVVDQGQCGDCYGVSSSDAETGAFIKAGWGKADGSFKISDQYGLDCGAYEGGCNGGDEAQVIDVMKSKGFPAEKWVDSATGNKMSDYGPYKGSPGSCQLKSGAKLWQLKDWGYVAGDQGSGPATLDEYKAALMTYGQLSIALDASSFDNYNGGVIARLGNSVDHAITCVGWDDTKKALHCRNNWGTSWGEQGYCWISYDTINQIVEPIWLQAPSGPSPVPPVPPVPPGPTNGVPVISSSLTANAVVGTAFSYQIVASNNPTSYSAAALPTGFTCSPTGLITGTATAIPANNSPISIVLIAINVSGAGTATLSLTVTTTPLHTATITLTTDQIESVISQSGLVTVTPDMTVKQLIDALNKVKKPDQNKFPDKTKTDCNDCKQLVSADLDKVIKDLQTENKELKRSVDAIIKALLPAEPVAAPQSK